jgi:DNA processing protein
MEVREFTRNEWPRQLEEIPQTPKKLWMSGTLPKTPLKYLAVVGSRAASRYGAEACEKLISGLAGYPISIVSGLALGIDTCAHRAALSTGLHTIAFPGSGLSEAVLYPKTNLKLARDIVASGGALISEYAPETGARQYFFPERNRLMVGISDAVLVIEAGEQSGTLITARLAAEYNRDLLCIPHRIGDTHGFGPHLFIRLGATLITESAHILEALSIVPRTETEQAESAPNLEGTDLVIWNMLSEPKTRDELLRESALDSGLLLTALIALELRGILKEEFGAWRRV